MIEAAIPDDEDTRLRKLYDLGILDTLEEQAYDDLTKLAAEICKTPIALISLIDSNRQWFKSHHGLDVRETPRDYAFCAHAILNDDLFIVEDSSNDERFFDNPLVTDGPHVKFYAGAPLIMSDNSKIGTLCVIGNEGRTISNAQKEALLALARQVVSQLELRLKIKELKVLDHAKDEFISMVNHELRTPLTSIYGSLSLLNNSANTFKEEYRGLINISFNNTERLLVLVNDILMLAKIESGQLELNIKKFNIITLLEKSVELNQQFCTECNTKLVINYPENNKYIRTEGDEDRLLQVISNFISNAAKFTYKNDVIEINIGTEGNHVIVEITDHGPGIPLDQQDLVFKKFKQLNAQTNNKMPGTGLGLNISKNIIELHQGVIGFESIPDINTTFYFKLPIMN